MKAELLFLFNLKKNKKILSQDVLFISFYTFDGKYPELAKKLTKSLNKFDLKSHILKLQNSFKTWEEGTHFKSKFILQCLLKFRKPVVWMDIDTEIWRYPELLFGDHDFAIYNWLADKNHHLDGKIIFDPKTKLLLCSGGVQKYAYTAPAIHILINWIGKIEEIKNKKVGDDPILDQAFNEGKFDLKTLWLPKTYNRMENHSIHWSKIPVDQIFINHSYTPPKDRKHSSKLNKGF